jgi:8-oxo-dGTP diphosphatase
MQPAVTVDVIVEEVDSLVLIRRRKDPYKGMLALPGGFVEYGETIETAALREIKEETSLEVRLTDILGVYSDPTRDPRGHVLSVVFVARQEAGKLRKGDDASSADWYSLKRATRMDLAFDHGRIIEDYAQWKTKKGTYWQTKSRC